MKRQARIAALSASVVVDGAGKRGALPAAIRRLTGTGVVGGPAVTARCGPRSAEAMFHALETAGPGAVLCVTGEGEWAYFGEISATTAVAREVAAVVVDGYVRDVEGLQRLGLSVFARGTTPIGGSRTHPGEVGVTLRIGEVEVSQGDWLVGDADGVVAVPAAELEATLARAEELASAEAKLLARLGSS